MNWKKGVLIGSSTLLILASGVYLGTKIGDSSTKENSKADSKVEEKKDIDLLEKVKQGKDFELTFDYFKESTDVNFKIDGKKSNKLTLETKDNNLKLIDSESKEILSELNSNAKEVSDPSKVKYEFKNSDTTFKLNDLSNANKDSENINMGYFEEGKNKFDLNISNMVGNSFEIKEFDDKEFEQRIKFDFDLVDSKKSVFKGNNQIYSFDDEYKGIMTLEKSENSDFNIFDLILFEISSYSSSNKEEPKTEEIEKEDSESTEDFDFSSVKFDDNFIKISNNKTNFYATDTLMYQVQILKDKIFPQNYHVKNGRDTSLVSAEFIKNPTEHFMNLIKDDDSSIRYNEVVINTDDYDNIRVYKDNVVNEHIIITLKDGELLATVNASLDLKEDIRLKTSKLTFRTKDFKNAIENKDVTQVYNPSATTDSPFIHVEKDPSITNLGMDKYLEGADTFVLFNEDMNDSYSIIMNQINVSDDYINTAIATLIAIDQQFIFKDIEYNK